MPSSADIAAAQQTLSNLLRLQILVTGLVQNPHSTQQQIDTVVTAANMVPTPKPTASKDGISVDWTGYLTALGAEIDLQMVRIQRLSGPFEVRSRMR